MHVDAARGKLVIRFGQLFNAHEVARAAETISAFAPVSSLTLDFSRIREFQDAAVAPLAAALARVEGAEVQLRGLTHHQSRVLSYFSVGDGGARA